MTCIGTILSATFAHSLFISPEISGERMINQVLTINYFWDTCGTCPQSFHLSDTVIYSNIYIRRHEHQVIIKYFNLVSFEYKSSYCNIYM